MQADAITLVPVESALCPAITYFIAAHLWLSIPAAWQAEPSPPASPVPPPPFLLTPFHTMLAARAGQVAKPVSQSTVATRQYHRHQLPHSRGEAWQPHGNHMVQSEYTTTGTRVGQEKWVHMFVSVCVCVCVGIYMCVFVSVCVCVCERESTAEPSSSCPKPSLSMSAGFTGSHCVFLISVSFYLVEIFNSNTKFICIYLVIISGS